MSKIKEVPVLNGFHPNSDIIRVDDTYYLVSPTNEWYPGYQLFKSEDLQNWTLINRPSIDLLKIDLRAVPDSGGSWTPSISYNPDEKLFYLLYSNIRQFDSFPIDSANYIATAKDIEGEWSEPIYLNSCGFNGALFHDDDGKTYFVISVLDPYQPDLTRNIYIQQYDCKRKRLIGDRQSICVRSVRAYTESIRLIKRNSYYYLLINESREDYSNYTTLFRSQKITEPFEQFQSNTHSETSSFSEHLNGKVSIGSLVELANGDWYSTYSITYSKTKKNNIATLVDTGVHVITWCADNWLRLEHNITCLQTFIETSITPVFDSISSVNQITFDSPEIDKGFLSPRVAMSEDWVTQIERPGYLRLYGRQSLCSVFEQSLVANRVRSEQFIAETCLEYFPNNYQQMAGITYYFNTYNYYYLYASGAEGNSKKFLNIIVGFDHQVKEPLVEAIDITNADKVWLKVEVNRDKIQFYYAIERDCWQVIGPMLCQSEFHSNHSKESFKTLSAGLTGTYIGLASQDLSGQRAYADFEYFSYQEQV